MVLCYYCRKDGFVEHDAPSISINAGKRDCPECGSQNNLIAVRGSARKETGVRDIRWTVVLDAGSTERIEVEARNYQEAISKAHEKINEDTYIQSVSPK